MCLHLSMNAKETTDVMERPSARMKISTCPLKIQASIKPPWASTNYTILVQFWKAIALNGKCCQKIKF